MFEVLGKIRPRIEYKFWAGIGHDGQTLTDLIAKMRDIGNEVLEVDQERQQILVGKRAAEGEPVWGCRFCLQLGSLVIVDTEAELNAHATEVHGWKCP